VTGVTEPVLRVSLDVGAVPPHPVGAGRYTLDLARALAARADVSMLLWARRDDRSRWAAMGLAVHAREPVQRPLRLAWEQVRLPRLLRGSDVAVHHGPHYTMPERAAVPVVVTVHDLTFLEHPEWHERVKVPVFRRAIAVAARRAAALVCVSATTADRLRERCDPVGRVFVVPHGVDRQRFTPDEPRAGADRDALGRLGVHPPYVLFVGTIEPRKAVPVLVAAFDRIATRHPELRLVLAGRPGWGADALAQALGSARHRDRVVRLGYVGDETVPVLLRNAAAVAYPALEEGFGLPALEALACGAPLVTTTGTAMAEMAGEAALLVPPGDAAALAEALATAVDGGHGADRRRRLGLEVAAAHSWDASAAGHLAAYRWAAAYGRPAAAGTDRERRRGR